MSAVQTFACRIKKITNYSDVYQNDYAVIYEKLVTFRKDAKKQLKVVRQMACDLKQQADKQTSA